MAFSTTNSAANSTHIKLPSAAGEKALLRCICGLMLAAALLLTGCVSVPPMPSETPVSQNPAVVSLFNRAQEELTFGRYTSAEAHLERALRIEPGNAQLWYELAQAAMLQNKFAQAESFALRANSYSRNNREHATIWQMIAESRAERGDHGGADEAMRRADHYRNR